MKAMGETTYRTVVWGLALGGTILDQATKYGVFRWLYDPQRHQGEYDVVPGAFKLLAQFTDRQEQAGGGLAWLRTVSGDLLPKVNHGALFGLGNDYSRLANGIFAVVSVVAAVAIVLWSLRASTARDLPLCAALGLILAGTLGNLYDRVVFDGVRDFLYFYWIEWPVFNVADCCLVVGAVLLLAQAFFSRPVAAGQQVAAASLASNVVQIK
jgi:lipoprotein signal peptidase